MRDAIAYLIVVAVIYGASLWFSSERCEAKTDGIGMLSKWSVFGGCQVKTPQGWVPLENYRAL
jgi:hypothetical protein